MGRVVRPFSRVPACLTRFVPRSASRIGLGREAGREEAP